ncbi:HAD family hydrolase [Bariatricus sp. SGI.154]|uniref:HAD family hydrolase n=1 Tax=Bariatricus sp. SGI.154 TaxID=3420549 RepID=UPI003D07EBEC
MIKGAIFDVDGTLLDSTQIWDDAASRYLVQMGITPEPELGKILFPMSVKEGAEYLKKRYFLHQDCERIAEDVLRVVKDFYVNEAPLKNGAAEFLGQLADKGIPMVVATSSEKMYIRAAFERHNILKYFRKIYTCSEVGAGKSKPIIYHRAAEELGTIPEETYVFEDALHAIRTAADAGFRTVGVYDRFSEADQDAIRGLADVYLLNMTKLQDFWKQIGNTHLDL